MNPIQTTTKIDSDIKTYIKFEEKLKGGTHSG